VEDSAAKVEVLLQAAEAQQSLAASALEQLREHAARLDATVRDEIRATLIEELRALGEEARAAAATLRALKRGAHLRFLLLSATSAALAAAVPITLAWGFLPTPEEVAQLRAARDGLRAEITQLERQGARIEFSHCGAARRLCVRVEGTAPAYGAAGEFRVLKGY
jgi:hypothetical protein